MANRSLKYYILISFSLFANGIYGEAVCTRLHYEEMVLQKMSDLEYRLNQMETIAGKKSAFTVTGAPAAGSETNSLKFTSVITNIGQHYSTETGQFTCEYPGIYVFSLNILKAGGANRANCEIRQNQVNVALAHSNPDPASNGGWYSSSASAVIRLAYGDIVNVVCSSGLSSLYEHSFYNSFSGFLIKAD